MAKHLSTGLSTRRAFEGLYKLECCKNAVTKENIATCLADITCLKCKALSTQDFWYYHERCGAWSHVNYKYEYLRCTNCIVADNLARNKVQDQLWLLQQECIFCGKKDTEHLSFSTYMTCTNCDSVFMDWLKERAPRVIEIEELRHKLDIFEEVQKLNTKG
jgi:hypothetical protein